MAYLLDDEDDQEMQAPEAIDGNRLGGIVSSLGGTGAAPGGTAPAAGTNSGKFVNFDRYLNANKDAATAGANRLADGIGKQGLDAKIGLVRYDGQFNQAVKDGTPQYGGETAYKLPTDRTPQSNYTQEEAPKTTWDAAQPGTKTYATQKRGLEGTPSRASPEDKRPTREEFVKKVQTGYSGPTWYSEIDGYGDMANKLQTASDQAAALGDRDKLLGLLQQRGGGTNFDAAMYGAVGQKKFNDVSKRYANLDDLLSKYTTRGDATAKQGKVVGDNVQRTYQHFLTAEDIRRENELNSPKPADPVTEANVARGNEISRMADEGYFGEAWNASGSGGENDDVFPGLTPELVAKMTPEEVARLEELWAEYIADNKRLGLKFAGSGGDPGHRYAFMGYLYDKYGPGEESK